MHCLRGKGGGAVYLKNNNKAENVSLRPMLTWLLFQILLAAIVTNSKVVPKMPQLQKHRRAFNFPGGRGIQLKFVCCYLFCELK